MPLLNPHLKGEGKVGAGASYYAFADDVVTMAKLIGDLAGAGARAYIKSYGGKPHIILKKMPELCLTLMLIERVVIAKT